MSRFHCAATDFHLLQKLDIIHVLVLDIRHDYCLFTQIRDLVES